MWLNRHPWIVFFFFLFTAVSCHGQNQDQSTSFFTEGMQLSFGLSDEGKMESTLRPHGIYLTPLSLLRAFEDEKVFSDLEIVDFQREDFAVAIQNIESAIEEYEKFKKEEGVSDAAEKAIFQRVVLDGEESVKAILLPHQIERVKQVLNQYEVKRVGLAGAICFGNLSREIELSSAQKKRLQSESIKFYKSKIAEIDKHKQSSISEIRNILNTFQEDKLEHILGEQIVTAPLFLCIERAKEDFWISRNSTHEELPESFKKWWPLAMNEGFHIDEIGTFVDRPQPTDSKDEIRNSLMLFFKNPAFVSKIELSKQQIAVFQRMQAAQITMTDQWKASIETAEPGEAESNRKKWIQIADELRDKQIEEIERVLDSNQKELMKRFVCANEVQKMGIELSLVHGLLGDELSITEGQKKKIEDQMHSFSESCRQLLVDLEREATQNTISQLTKKQVQALEAQLGDDLSLSAGLIEFHSILMGSDEAKSLVAHLSQGANRAFLSYLVKQN